MKKLLIVVVMMLSLLAAGCTEDGKAITQSVINSIDIQSQQGRTVLRVEMSPGIEDELPLEVLEALQQGITLEYAQESTDKLMMEIKLTEAVELPLPDTSISSLSIYVEEQNVYIGIFPEDPYLKIDYEELFATSDLTFPFAMNGLTGFTAEKREKDKNFIKSYLDIFGYKLPKVTNHGTVNIALPDGEVDATYYQTTLNEVDLKNIILFILKDLQSNDLIKEYIWETLTQTAELMDEEMSQEEFEELFAEIQAQIGIIIMELEAFEMSELGVKATYDAHYWIDEQGYARKNLNELLISSENVFLPDEYIKLVIETELWNVNKPINISFPENYISLTEIIEDETVIMNTKLFQVIDSFGVTGLYDEPTVAVFEIDNPLYDVDWEPAMMEVSPEVQEGVVFIPLYVMAEITGAKLEWNSQAREAYYFDGVNEILVPVDKPEAMVNGQVVVLSAPAHIKSDRIMVPVRFISEAIGAEVFWLEETKEIILTVY